ncbi:MAG: exonuclease domain-containing protein [Bacteroidia bacterium]
MFAIVDIETCGSKFEFRRGRIIEICIVLHDGLSVTEVYSTLINPECYISPFYTKISGITNEMVAEAPKFHEVAAKIIELTEGRIFVAHNVGFDYSFVRDEFASLGYKFKRDTLCTVKLSRKLMPGKLSYSLGPLCESLGIPNEARHRAEGDAVATAKLFDVLLQLKNLDPKYRNKGVDELMVRRIDKIKQYILDKLPESCGVYYFLNKEGDIIYIGKSTNMYNRAISHFNSAERKAKKMLNELYNVDFTDTGSELVALIHEASEIKKHKPEFNRMRKSEYFTHTIDWYRNAQGVVCFEIRNYENSENALLSFNSYSSARERLDAWIEEYTLCLQYCGLTPEGSSCFNHQIRKCNGICCGEEETVDYNTRAEKILTDLVYAHEHFIIMDKGRNNNEYAVVLVEQGKYQGYGYIDVQDTVSSPEELKYRIKKTTYFPDLDNLIRGWLKKNRGVRIVPLKNKAVNETDL